MGWAIGLLGFGVVFGALSDQISGLEGAATEWYATFGGKADLLGAYWASMMQMAGMAVAAYVVTLLLRLHQDEAQGTLEPLLGTTVSRLRWLGAYVVNAPVGAVSLLVLFSVTMSIIGGQVLGALHRCCVTWSVPHWSSSPPSESWVPRSSRWSCCCRDCRSVCPGHSSCSRSS